MTEEKKVVKVKKVVKKAKPKFEGDKEFISCVGIHVEVMEKTLAEFQAEFKIDTVEFVRKFRAFRLYRKDAHVDWVSLEELSKLYGLRLPAFGGAERNYQKPLKRVWG